MYLRKSNVADAIRWVFGEQSNKNIRAKKTEDVIFVGSDSRRSMGIAEVTVVLDNEDKWIPLDFAEVSRIIKTRVLNEVIGPLNIKDIEGKTIDFEGAITFDRKDKVFITQTNLKLID